MWFWFWMRFVKLSTKKKKKRLCTNVPFFTWSSLAYPCKQLADRLELYIFTFKFFEWFMLIKRKYLLEWFLFCSSVFIFWCQISFGLMVWLYTLTLCVCVCIFTEWRKAFTFSYVGNFTTLKSDSTWMLQLQESHSHLAIFSEEEIHEDSLISRLLWWLTFAIILGKLSWKSNGFDPKISNRFKLGPLQSLLDLIENECDESFKNRFGWGLLAVNSFMALLIECSH